LLTARTQHEPTREVWDAGRRTMAAPIAEFITAEREACRAPEGADAALLAEGLIHINETVLERLVYEPEGPREQLLATAADMWVRTVYGRPDPEVDAGRAASAAAAQAAPESGRTERPAPSTSRSGPARAARPRTAADGSCPPRENPGTLPTEQRTCAPASCWPTGWAAPPTPASCRSPRRSPPPVTTRWPSTTAASDAPTAHPARWSPPPASRTTTGPRSPPRPPYPAWTPGGSCCGAAPCPADTCWRWPAVGRMWRP